MNIRQAFCHTSLVRSKWKTTKAQPLHNIIHKNVRFKTWKVCKCVQVLDNQGTPGPSAWYVDRYNNNQLSTPTLYANCYWYYAVISAKNSTLKTADILYQFLGSFKFWRQGETYGGIWHVCIEPEWYYPLHLHICLWHAAIVATSPFKLKHGVEKLGWLAVRKKSAAFQNTNFLRS